MGKFNRHKARQDHKLQRKRPKRSPYERVLIVCEGEKTEPNYLNELIREKQLNTANIKVTGESGSDPMSIVKEAQRLYKAERKTGETYDRVYCVFDKDSHTNFDEALDKISKVTPKHTYFAITSTPCFEYWVLLHFQYTDRSFTKAAGKSPCDCVNDAVKVHFKKTKGFPDGYCKGDKGLFGRLEGRLEDAIKNSEKVKIEVGKFLKPGETVHDQNPTTLMHELVDYLMKLKK